MSATLEKGVRVLKEVIDAPIASYFSSCVHCGICAEACPTKAIAMVDESVYHDHAEG